MDYSVIQRLNDIEARLQVVEAQLAKEKKNRSERREKEKKIFYVLTDRSLPEGLRGFASNIISDSLDETFLEDVTTEKYYSKVTSLTQVDKIDMDSPSFGGLMIILFEDQKYSPFRDSIRPQFSSVVQKAKGKGWQGRIIVVLLTVNSEVQRENYDEMTLFALPDSPIVYFYTTSKNGKEYNEVASESERSELAMKERIASLQYI